jgi:hypothetical protein
LVQGSGVAFVGAAAYLYSMVGTNQIRTAAIAFGVLGTIFMWAIALAALRYSVPNIKLEAPYKSIDGNSTVPGALPLFRKGITPTKFEVSIRLSNIGKGVLSNALAKIEVLGNVDLRCVNRSFNQGATNPRDGSAWHNTIEVQLGNMRPGSLPSDLILTAEVQRSREDSEVKCTIFGDELPATGKLLTPKLVIQMPRPEER